MNRRRRHATRPRLECLENRLVLSTLSVAQLETAYGLNSVNVANGAVHGNGAGQTIAIIDPYHDPSIYSDLVAFDARNGLVNPYLAATNPAVSSPYGTTWPAFSMVNFAGTTTNSSWSSEEALDVEMAHATAPMANIVVVEAKSPGTYDFLAAINAVKTLPGVSVISVSWGGPEFQGQQGFDSTFSTPIGHEGITFLASTGDDGAGAQWPASSPNVVGVGGTSLTVNSAGVRAGESSWTNSGGGPSQIVTKPAYQDALVAGAVRSTPDVALDADPNTGVSIVSQGQTMYVGGTSMSAPIWAGLIAIADQGLAIAGKSTLDGPSQTLPDLYKAPIGSFFDVSAGSRATPGYDDVTGLGSPNAPALVGLLDAMAENPALSIRTGLGLSTQVKATSTSTSIQADILTSPASPVAQIAPSSISPAALPNFVANLVAVGTPTTLIDPQAADAVLAAWDDLGMKPKGVTLK